MKKHLVKMGALMICHIDIRGVCPVYFFWLLFLTFWFIIKVLLDKDAEVVAL